MQINNVISREELFTSVKSSVYPSVITTYDFRNPTILFANSAHEVLTGYNSDELIGKNPRLFQGKDTVLADILRMKDGLRDFDSWEGNLINYKKCGASYSVFIVIFGISIDTGEKFYVAVKKQVL